MNKKLGFITLLLAAASFGSFGIWIRLLSQGINIYQQIVLRNLVAMIIASVIIIFGKRYLLDFKKIPKIKLLLYALVVPISVIFYNIAMLSLKIAVATFVFYIGTILCSYVIGLVIFKEKVTVIKAISIMLVLLGLTCFVYPFSFTAATLGFVAGIISGIFDGAANGFRKDLVGKIDKLFLVFLTAVGGIIVSGLMIVQTHASLTFLTQMPLQIWLIGILFGLLLIINNFLLLVGFQNYELGPGVIVLSSELFFALIFGFLIFHEIPATNELIGGLFIISAIVAPNINWQTRKEKIQV